MVFFPYVILSYYYAFKIYLFLMFLWVLTILLIAGLLFSIGIAVNYDSNKVSYEKLVLSGVKEINADGPCIPPPPGLPNNCNP